MAEWPQGTLPFQGDISDDVHGSKEDADAVCGLLLEHGLGGDRKIFPIQVWIEPEDPSLPDLIDALGQIIFRMETLTSIANRQENTSAADSIKMGMRNGFERLKRVRRQMALFIR